MRLEQRVLHQTTDISEAVNDFRTGTYTFAYTTGQYLYVGSLLPFNHLFIELGTVNLVAATTTVEMWWNNAWVAAVDLYDGTAGLTASGRMQWNTNIDEGWSWERESADVTGLSSTKIYDMFWLRLSWSANLTGTTSFKYIGQKFSDDAALYSYYPDLNNQDLRDSFDPANPSGTKTTWNEQHYMATEMIKKDLIKRSIIKARAQILDPYLFKDAACHKVAEIAYQGFGRPYFDQLKVAIDRYKQEMDIKYYNVDTNQDARLDPHERILSSGFLTR